MRYFWVWVDDALCIGFIAGIAAIFVGIALIASGLLPVRTGALVIGGGALAALLFFAMPSHMRYRIDEDYRR